MQHINPSTGRQSAWGQAHAHCDHYTWRMESLLSFSHQFEDLDGQKTICQNRIPGTTHCGPGGTSLEILTGYCGGTDPACPSTRIAYGDYLIDLAPTGVWLLYDEDACTATGTRLHCSEEWVF
jgi:hypothetical protein